VEEFLRTNAAEDRQIEILKAITAEIQPETILEIGTGWGISAIAFLPGNKTTLLTIDPIENLEEFECRTKHFGVRDRIQRLVGRSGENCSNEQYHSKKTHILAELKLQGRQFSLIFIDGSHNYKDVKNDFEQCLGLVKEGGTIILDDYLHSHNATGEYGVFKATAQIALANKLEYRVYPAANGIARFDF
jgi:predicted O-methyltransferase YrrM